jgi:vitamin B12 transporter
MKIRLKWVVVLGVSVLISGIAGDGFAAPKEEDRESAITLEEMVVTAGRIKEKKEEITTNVTIIDKKDIEDSSATDVGDLLAEKGIGHIHKYPGVSTAVGVRGFRTDCTGVDLAGHVLLLIDGRRAGTGNAAKIMTKNIERIEVIRGPASVQYGSAAVGGVINIITKQGKDKPTVFVEGLLGSYNYREGSAGFSGKYNAFDFSGSFTRDSRDDYDTAGGKKYLNTDYDHRENGSFNFGYEFLPGNRLGVIYNYFDADHVGNPGYLSQNDKDDYSDSGNRSVDFIYDGKTMNELFSWKLRYFDGKDEDKFFCPTKSKPDGWDDGISQKVTVDYKGAQSQFSYNQKYLLLTAGFDWANYETKDSKYSPKNTEYDNRAGFLLAKARLFDQKLMISSGVRYDEYEVDMKGDGGKETDNNTSPTVGAAYLLTDWLKARINYAEAFKMPTAQQMAGDMKMPGVHYVGNPNLKPEKGKTYEGGMDISYASFTMGLTYFHTDFKDKIEAYTKPDGNRSYRNLGKAEIEGLEGNLSYDIGSLFSWDYQVNPYVSFTYLTKYKDKEANEDLKWTSDLQISYGITVSDLNGFSANLNLAYTGKQEIIDYEHGTCATITKGSFMVANFTIAKKIVSSKKYGGITLRGEIQNLFDEDYEYVQGYPMPGRMFFLGLRYDF